MRAWKRCWYLLLNAVLLGKLPIDPELARLCDEGDVEHYDSEIVAKIDETVNQLVKD